MRPIKLTLENFGPYRERATVDFSALGDFFLVCGKTGSGKSTLFDAITYALYGRAPGARRSHEATLVSNYAEPGDKPFVEFEFELAQSRYKIERTPPYLRRKKGGRPDDLVSVSPNATMYQFASKWEVVEEGQDKVSERIERLVGLSADEFSKVILLPQGEFQNFLDMNSKKRSEILEKLFPVELHSRVTELAKAKSDAARQRLENYDSQIAEFSRELGEEPEARLSALRDTAISAAQREKEALENVKARQHEQDVLQQHLEQLQKVKQAVDVVATLQAQGPNEDARSGKIRKAKAAAGVMPYIEAFERARLTVQRAATAAQSATDEYERHRAKADEVARWQRRLVELVELIRQAQEKKIRLEGRVEKWKQHISVLDAFVGAQGALSMAEKAAEAKAKERATLEIEIETVRPNQDEVIKTRAKLEKFHAVQEEFLKFEAKTDRKAELEVEVEARRAALEACELAYRNAQSEAQRAKAAQNALSERLGKAEAVHLALQLRDGEPCPVCGSVHHPAPAVPPRPAGGSTEAGEAGQIANLREELERASEDANKASMALAGAQASLDSARQRLSEAEGQVKTVDAELVALRKASPNLDEWLGSEFSHFSEFSRSSRFSDAQSAVRDARRRLDAALKSVRDELDALDSRSKRACELEAKLKLARSEEELQAAALQEARSRHAACKATLQAREADSGATDPGPEYEVAVARVDALATERDSLQKACQEWENLKGKLLTRKDTLALALRGAQTAFAEELPRLVAAMQAAGFLPLDFMSERTGRSKTTEKPEAAIAQKLEVAIPHEVDVAVAEARRCTMPADELVVEEAAEAAYKEAVTKAVATAQALMGAAQELVDAGQQPTGAVRAGELADKTLADRLESALEDCKARIADEDRALALANEELAKARQAAESSRRDVQRLEEGIGRLNAKKAEREKALAESRGLYELQALLSGDINGRRLPFKNFVLGMYFGEVVVRASNHLSQMSDGRFYLKQAQGEGAGRAKTGLDIAVLDAWTGAERPTDTLSGGEKFLTSISLALGLADSIRERAGGVALDSVFIDEGFGSLDEESLEKAIVVLNRIRGTRTIGIVSHVAELRSRIPARIEVEKSPSGSHLHVVSVPDQAE